MYRLVILVLVVIATSTTAMLPIAQAAEPITFTQTMPTVVALGSDYAYDVRGLGWDFSDPQHFGYDFTRVTFGRNSTLSDGMFVGTTSNDDPKIWLLEPPIPNTVPTQNEGAVKPINGNRYRYLSFRMCASANTGALVWWHSDRSFAPGTYGAAGAPSGQGFKNILAGCHTYVVDLQADRFVNAGSLAWNAGPVRGLNIRASTAANITVKLDYVRLSATPPADAPTVTARWTPASGTFDLFFDTAPDGRNATLIAKGVNSSTGTYTWRTPQLYPGTYYLIARNGSSQSVSPPIRVNTPPQATIVAPSYTSGPDYATTVAGNAWDMNSADDVSLLAGVKNTTFRDGVLTATSIAQDPGDPAVYLNTPTPIDPARFYYITYRMRMEGEQDIGMGSVARVLWWTGTDVARTASTTKDVLGYSGWRTVSVDLRNAQLEPGSASTWSNTAKRGLRLDPHEFPTERTFALDNVLLTGNDRASTTFAVRYNATDADGQQPSVALFYDTDRDGINGMPIRCGGAAATVAASSKIYIPMAVTSGSGGTPGCTWNVASVPNGDYWVYAVVSDGLDRVVVGSDTPVEVRH